ncbi:MAG: citramalate synthase [Pseudomonadota bacterium]
MQKDRLYLFDTTLRDGAQTPGIDFSLEDKLQVIGLLERLGVDYVEGGYPGANPLDTALFSQARSSTLKMTAFGMTKRAGRSVSNDPGFAGILNATCDAICLVAKAWDFHVRVALGVSLEENLASISESVTAVTASGREAMIDCEHFFDGYKANPDYAVSCVRAALDAGARWAVLCDTNGGSLPHEVSDIIGKLIATGVPGDRLGIHTHDDTGHAVANSLAAVDAGVRQIQGTLNGIGERCGNANLIALIPTLCLKEPYASRLETSVTPDRLRQVTAVARAFDELLNRAPDPQAAYVGSGAFATKAGIHASAIVKDPATYEHVAPDRVGNTRHVLVSDQAGRSNILSELQRFGLDVARDDPAVERLLEEVKHREAEGYAYEAADASFELLARRALDQVPHFFDIKSFRVMIERRFNAIGELVTISEATVKVSVDGVDLMSVGEGNGPVNALDQALRKDLGRYQRFISDLELTDYKVRILNGGTAATTRVLIESRDGAGRRWSTIGVSPNIVDASFQALIDSVTYKLLIEGASASRVAA